MNSGRQPKGRTHPCTVTISRETAMIWGKVWFPVCTQAHCQCFKWTPKWYPFRTSEFSNTCFRELIYFLHLFINLFKESQLLVKFGGWLTKEKAMKREDTLMKIRTGFEGWLSIISTSICNFLCFLHPKYCDVDLLYSFIYLFQD